MIKFYKVILLCSLFFHLAANAQTEYIVTVNPTTGIYTKIDSIPGVRWLQGGSTYNQTTKEYTVMGLWQIAQPPVYLYTLDAVTGQILLNPQVTNPNSIISMQYSRTTGILYGMVYVAGAYHFAVIDKTTGTHSILNTIPGIDGVSSFVIDEERQRMYIRAVDNNPNFALWTIDLATGNIIYHVPTAGLGNLQYDNVSKKLYALRARPASPNPIVVLCTVDPATGIVTDIADLPAITGIPGSLGETFNENSHIYIFPAVEQPPQALLYSVDVNSGNVISKPPIPISSLGTADNLIFFRHDNLSNILYALFWEANTTSPPPDTCRLDSTLQLLGSSAWCTGSSDSTILKVKQADSIQWFKDNIAIPGANDSIYRVTQSGTYHARLFSFPTCVKSTIFQKVNIYSTPVAGFTVNNNAQCLLNNRFVFANTSTNAVGGMQYQWKFGDGAAATTRNTEYSYTTPGTYKVVMIVSNSACADSVESIITVYPDVLAAFTAAPACINLPVLPVNNTIDPGNASISYLWDFGNGITSTLRNPPAQVYTSPGNYEMSLTVTNGQCPNLSNIQKHLVSVDAPRPGVNNPVQVAIVNLPLTLHARQFGNNVLWWPASNLDNPANYTPTFIGNKEQLYTVEIRTASGCITVDTQLVKILKSIEIYVPNSFTPNNDGRNDILRPITIGIKELSFFRVYNRLGQIIFETRDMGKGWDGFIKGTPADVQTLVWIFEGIGVDNKVYKARGTTVLIR